MSKSKKHGKYLIWVSREAHVELIARKYRDGKSAISDVVDELIEMAKKEKDRKNAGTEK